MNEYYSIIENLIPTHNSLRNPNKVQSFLKAGKVMTAKISIINGDWYVHDGHHRVVAYLIDPNIPLVIKTEEYSLEDYRLPNPPLWLTPFDPISEVRLANFRDYKKIAKGRPVDWLIKNKFLYAEKRRVHTMKELADEYRK